MLAALTSRDLATIDAEALHAAAAAATPAHARVARNVVELFCLWLPPLLPTLLPTLPASEAPFLAVIDEWARRLTPQAYLAIFAGLLARQSDTPEDELRAVEAALEPAKAMLEMLATRPPRDLPGVLSRLRPLQRLKLEYALNAATGARAKFRPEKRQPTAP